MIEDVRQDWIARGYSGYESADENARYLDIQDSGASPSARSRSKYTSNPISRFQSDSNLDTSAEIANPRLDAAKNRPQETRTE